MTIILPVLIGAALSLLLAYLLRTKLPRSERRVYAVGLVMAALIYLILGVVGGASARCLALESLGVFIYGAAAWAGLRGWSSLLAMGWAAHVGWDMLLHVNGTGAEYTPAWYPWLCVSFDLIMAGAVLSLIRRGIADIHNRA